MPQYNRSESLKELAPALAKAMGEIGPALKDSTNPHFKSKYANLAACHAVAIGPLRDNGFSFPMFPSYDRETNTLSVTAVLLHSSGESIEGTLSIPLRENANAQDVLAAETYCRRGLYAIVGVIPDDDDDGETAVGRGQAQEARDRRQAPSPKPEPKAAPVVSQRPASEPPPRMVPREQPDEQEDTRSAKSVPEVDQALADAFGKLRDKYSVTVLNNWAKGLSGGKFPSAWNVTDAKRFLKAFTEGARP